MSLFGGQSLSTLFQGLVAQMRAEIGRFTSAELHRESRESIASDLAAKYSLEVPVIDIDGMHTDPPGQSPNDQITLTVHAPFTGDERIFNFAPRVAPMLFRTIRVNKNELIFEVHTSKSNPEAGIAELRADIRRIQEGGLKSAAQEVSSHNSEIQKAALIYVDQRIAEFNAHETYLGKLESLIPIKRRNDGNERIIVPVVRKHITIAEQPKAEANAEPAIDVKAYDDILRVIDSMAKVIERSPSVFRDMEEEDLRTILLVGLNGIFEGKATAETFNGAGKTDILIRVGDRNVFIAECLIWNGPEHLLGKIDNQLFRYATWRDSKLAILIFNRNKNFSNVLERMKNVCEAHPLRFQTMAYAHEGTGYRYTFRRADDSQRHCLVTIVGYDLKA